MKKTRTHDHNGIRVFDDPPEARKNKPPGMRSATSFNPDQDCMDCCGSGWVGINIRCGCVRRKRNPTNGFRFVSHYEEF